MKFGIRHTNTPFNQKTQFGQLRKDRYNMYFYKMDIIMSEKQRNPQPVQHYLWELKAVNTLCL